MTEPVTRQTTKHSTHSILVVPLDDPNLSSFTTAIPPEDEEECEGKTICVSPRREEAEMKTEPLSQLPWYKRLWKGTQDNINPRDYPRFKKNAILTIVGLAGAISPISTTIYNPALVDMQRAFHTSDVAMNASISVFTFITAIFPLIWATFGELFGRRPIYLISFLIGVVGNVCSALSTNIAMFIAFRAVAAIGSSSVMSMGAGTISDIFEPFERGRAFAYYTTGPLLGPALGPIIGGYLNVGLGWQSTFWFLAIFGILIWLSILFFLPETWRPAPSQALPTEGIDEKSPPTKPSKIHKLRGINPAAPLGLLRYPNIALTVSFVAITFMLIYLNSITFTRLYTLQYGLDSGTVGLCYLSNAFGGIIGGIIGGRFSDHVYNKRVEKANGESHPEMRLGGIVFNVSIALQVASLIAYGWCMQKNVHMAAGLVCQFFVGLSLMVPNVTLSAYMVDCFRHRGSSVTGGVGSLVASEILHAMGPGGTFTFFACLILVWSGNLAIVIWKGKKWTAKRLAKGVV